MRFHKINRLLMNETTEHGGEGGGNPQSTETPPVTNLLAGAGGESEQQSQEFLPEKYRVTKDDGSLDIEASARKLSEGYTNLEKRIGTGDLPPKEAKDYSLDFGKEAFMSFAEFKEVPENQEFLKQAHELGMTEKQMQFVLGEYVKRVPELVQAKQEIEVEEAHQSLSQVWKNENEFNSNLKNAFNAFQKYAAPEDLQNIDQIGNNPIVIKLLANIGKSLGEDNTAFRQTMGAQQQDIKQVMASEAYRNPSHADHKSTHEQVRKYYEETYGNQPVS